jgi:hypothetical protein
MALMCNAQLIENEGEEIIPINARKQFESDVSGVITIEQTPREPIFVYDAQTGEKLTDWTRADNVIQLNQPYRMVVIDYWYEYNNGCTIMRVGKPLTTGFLSLIGKTRVKDDTTGKVVTGIIKIPKLRLMSDLSMRVGSDAIP